VPLGVPTPKGRYAPWLSVRTVQPSGCEACRYRSQADLLYRPGLPPSVDRANSSGVGGLDLVPDCRNDAQQTYTFRRRGCGRISAQICSLSLGRDDCFETSTGGIQAFLSGHGIR